MPDAQFCGKCGAGLGQPASAIGNRAVTTQPGFIRVNQPLRSAINFFSPKCPHCGTKGEITYVGWEKAKVEHGFGIVTRQEVTSKVRRNSSGNRVKEQVVVNREERVPVVRTTIRQHYQCKQCGNAWTRDSTTQEEDFAPPPTERHSTFVVTKEVLRVPCKYCGTLIDPIQNSTCPRCGGRTI